MKRIIIVMGTFLFIVVLVGCFVFFKDRPKKINKIEDIKSFHYSYTVGNYYEASVVYELECKDKCSLKIKRERVTIEDATIYEVDRELVDELEDILNKYNVGHWNGFDKNNRNVLDGNSFTLSIKMDNNEEVYARGYMKWPKNYQEVKKDIIDLFGQFK